MECSTTSTPFTSGMTNISELEVDSLPSLRKDSASASTPFASDRTMTARYDTLSDDEIRLLKIDLCPVSNELSYALTVVSLSDEPRFTALSYVWGDSSITEVIVLDGEQKAITANLAAALRYVRRHWCSVFQDGFDSFWLWVDAICINQDNSPERGHQVKLMGKIYSHAELVIGWLGDNETDIPLALEAFDLVAMAICSLSEEDFYSLEWMRDYPSLFTECPDFESKSTIVNIKSWDFMRQFSELSYWSRAWIFQEIILAKKVLLCAADASLDFHKLEVISKRFGNLTTQIQQGRTCRPEFLDSSTLWLTLSTGNFGPRWGTFEIISHIRFFYKEGLLDSEENGGAEIRWTVSLKGGQLQAKDPKDHIYGLMSLTKIDIEVDYSVKTHVADVYRDYIAKVLEVFSKGLIVTENHELYFLRDGGIGKFRNDLCLPSWAPNYPEISKNRQWNRMPVGSAYQGVFRNDVKTAVVYGNSLLVSGVLLDVVSRTEEPLSASCWKDGTMLQYLEDFAVRNPTYGQGVDILLAFIQTIRFDSSNGADEVTVEYVAKFLRVISSSQPEKKLDRLAALLTRADETAGVPPSRTVRNLDSFMRAKFLTLLGPLLHQGNSSATMGHIYLEALGHFLADIIHLSKGWRFFETTTGYFGLTALGTKLGDQVFILKGSNLPVILRKQGDHWVHVGVCFILDLMNGEAAARVQSGECVVEMVEIR